MGAVLGTLTTGFFTLRAKRNEYINEYYKMVIARRVTAYEQLESLIVSMRTTVLGDDKKPYHFLFSQGDADGLLPAYQMLHCVTSHALWLSDEAFQKTKDINRLLWLFKCSGGKTSIEFGQQNYETLTTLREDLERILATDMLDLHEVEPFLQEKRKRPDPGLQPWV